MTTPLTIVLLRSPGSLFDSRLLDRPLWHWTLDAVRALKPVEVLLVREAGGAAEPEGVRAVAPSALVKQLARSDGKVIVVPAELPCLRPATLKGLLAAARSAPSSLSSFGEGATTRARVICATSREARSALGSPRGKKGMGQIHSALDAVAAAPGDPEDLLLVRTLADWARAAQILRRRKVEDLLSQGVFLDDPATVHIDPGVRVGRGTRLRSWVVIEGSSRIGSRCEIGSFSHIVDSEIGEGTVVLDHCFVRSSKIGKAAHIGPFAHLRPDSIVGADAKVGNFVELKKTMLGRGAKAPHLSYLGDAKVGARVNVGAGTITCNYDGERKHETLIEDGAFIGSDVQLVAPVRVGRGAYVAAGSCIVEDVPPGSLALARSRQVVKLGWARRKRSARSK